MFPSAPVIKTLYAAAPSFTNVDISLIDHLSRDHDARIWLVSSFIQTSQDEDEEEDKPEVVDVPL